MSNSNVLPHLAEPNDKTRPGSGSDLFPWARPLRGRLREKVADFLVDELPATVPEGHGEHVWLLIQKTGQNTGFVADCLARHAGVPALSVSYAGRKDRHAVTTQWFSVHLPGREDPDWTSELGPGISVLQAVRHTRKLKIGHLLGNRFRIRVRDVQGSHADAEALLARLSAEGIPDYFGAQRFGFDNLAQARAWFTGGRAPRKRDQRSLLLSAARAELFNRVLRARVLDGSWNRLEVGDMANLDGRGSVFLVTAEDAGDPSLAERCARGELHPTGPLWGKGGPGTRDRIGELELTLAQADPELSEGLERAGVEAARRPLRLFPEALQAEWIDHNTLELAFTLGPGAYATTVLAALGIQEQEQG